MSATPSKGPQPRRKAASASRPVRGNTSTDPRVTRSATRAAREPEKSTSPDNSLQPRRPDSPSRKIQFQVPSASNPTRSMEARTTKLHNEPSKPSKPSNPSETLSKQSNQVVKEDNSEKAASRAISTLLENFIPDKRGKRHNYVFETVVAKGDQPIYKIGMSKIPITRLGNLRSTCKFEKMREVRAAITDRPSKTAQMAERLIHTELGRFQCAGKCTCGTDHTEYFNVSERVALEAHHRWVDFCRQEPWGPDGKLLPFWKDRLEARRPLAEDCGYDGLAASWDDFTKPSQFDVIAWNIRLLHNALCESQFKTSCALAHAGCMACLWPSHPFIPGLICLGMYVICAWADERKSCGMCLNKATAEQQAAPAERVVGKKMAKGRGEGTTHAPRAVDTDLVVDDEEGRDAVPVANHAKHEEAAEVSKEERWGGPTKPYVVDSDDDCADTSAATLVNDECAEDSLMTGVNDTEEEEEDGKEAEDGDDGDEMDCDEPDDTTDDGILDLAQVMESVSLRGSSNLKAAIPASVAGDSPCARRSNRSVLVQA